MANFFNCSFGLTYDLFVMSICGFGCFPFGFDGRTLCLIASFPRIAYILLCS